MMSTWLPTVSPIIPSSEMCGASSHDGRKRNMPSPPRTPAENVNPKLSSSSGGGEKTAVPIRFQTDGPSWAAAVSTSSGKTSSPRIQP